MARKPKLKLRKLKKRTASVPRVRPRDDPYEREIAAVSRATAVDTIEAAPLATAPRKVPMSPAVSFFAEETYSEALDAAGFDVFREVELLAGIARDADSPTVRMAAMKVLRDNAKEALTISGRLLLGTSSEQLAFRRDDGTVGLAAREQRTAMLLRDGVPRVAALLEASDEPPVDEPLTQDAPTKDTEHEPDQHEAVPGHNSGAGIQRGTESQSPDAAGQPLRDPPGPGPDGGSYPADEPDEDGWRPPETEAQAPQEEAVYGHRPPAPGYLRPTDLGICTRPAHSGPLKAPHPLRRRKGTRKDG